MYTGREVKYLKRSGHARLGTHHGWRAFAEVLYGGREGSYYPHPVPFKTSGALRGEAGPAWPWACGRLPAIYRESASHADYVVYSYGTPIAWRGRDWNGDFSWFAPAVKYSRTTSRHQSLISTAIRNPPGNEIGAE